MSDSSTATLFSNLALFGNAGYGNNGWNNNGYGYGYVNGNGQALYANLQQDKCINNVYDGRLQMAAQGAACQAGNFQTQINLGSQIANVSKEVVLAAKDNQIAMLQATNAINSAAALVAAKNEAQLNNVQRELATQASINYQNTNERLTQGFNNTTINVNEKFANTNGSINSQFAALAALVTASAPKA
jgi:hypothetical protein